MLNRNRFNFESIINFFTGNVSIGETDLNITLDNGYRVIESPAVWRDEYAGAEWLAPNGASAPDKVAVTIGGISRNYYGFDGASTTEQMSNQIEIPHDVDIDALNAGTVKMEFHVHGFVNTVSPSGNVSFYVDLAYHRPYEQPETLSSVYIDFDLTAKAALDHLIRGVEITKPTGDYKVGSIFTINLRRVPTDEADTYENEFYLYKFAVHLPVNSKGTVTKYGGD